MAAEVAALFTKAGAAVRCVVFVLCLVAAMAARAQDIVQVLKRSQQVRMAPRGLADADSPAAARIYASVARLAVSSAQHAPVEVVLVGGDLFAEAVFGRRAVAVSLAVGDLPEGERLMMLAHELGHLQLSHWAALSALYQRHIPGEVRPETTEPVAAQLGAQAHALSHRQELDADRFGYLLLRRLGYGVDNAVGLLTRHGLQFDSATHPGTRRRLSQLRALDVETTAAALAGETSKVAARLPDENR